MSAKIASYDAYDALLHGSEWVGASAKAFWSHPAFALVPSPLPKTFAAWGEMTERACARLGTQPSWGIESVVTNGCEYVVNIECEIDNPFARLVHFKVERPNPSKRRVLLVAPMSGHYSTLLRKTVISLLPTCDVWVTEWRNPRDVPVSSGKFDVEDYTKYLMEFIRHLGTETNVVAVCQPAPLALAAVARIAEETPDAQPNTLTLIGGPVDHEAGPTAVSEFSNKFTIDQLESTFLHSVGSNYAGFGRSVYPGSQQLFSFMSMNSDTHSKAFSDQIVNLASGDTEAARRHDDFYDEYLSAMDMTAEFYLSTVERVFQNREIAQNIFTVDGDLADAGKITDTAVLIVEGENDDIAGPGQCLAALGLLTGISDANKKSILAADAGHYGIFSGKAWRNDIRPQVIEFIDQAEKARKNT